MTALVYIASGAALLIGVGLYIWARRWWAVPLYAVGLVAAYGIGFEVVGWPQKLAFEWRTVVEARVLGSRIVEGEAIYLWLGLPDTMAPRAYVMPYDPRVARELHEARERAAEGQGVLMKWPFDTYEVEEQMFYPMPQMPEPLKDGS